MSDQRAFGLRADLECLEPRENPSTWAGESFDQLSAPTLPAGWANWSNDGSVQYITSKLQAASGSNALASLGSSATQSRFWSATAYPADYGSGVTVRSNAAARLEVVARGSNLNTATPTYVSAVALPGGGVELTEVKAGVRTSLGKVNPGQPLPVNGVWLRVQLQPTGSGLGVTVQRADDGRFLTSAGGWQTAATNAIQANTTVTPAGGLLGVGRLSGGSGMAFADDVVVLTPAGLPENFDTTRPNPLPANWQSWASDAQPRAAVGGTRYFSSDSALSLTGTSATSARAWLGSTFVANAVVEASVFADSLIPAGVIVRGQNLNTATPSYYSLTAVRGLGVQLKRVVNGVETTLGSIQSAGYVSGQWVKLSLQANGSQLRGLVYRTDTAQWLAANGSWQSSPEAAFTVNDATIGGAGFAGVERAKSASGTVWVDDFLVRPVSSAALPKVTVTPSQPGTVSGTVRFTATVTPAERVSRIEFRLNGTLRSTQSASPAVWDLDSTTLTNGTHTLTVRAVDVDGNSDTATYTFAVQNSTGGKPDRPDGVRKYDHIRLTQLAYAGNPMGAYEKQLAANSLDLIVPNARFLGDLEAAAPDTPKVIYSNISNLYGDLLTDWFEYAGKAGADREAAFFHVTQATAFTGQSAASVPVREFWKVARGAADGSGSLTDLTREARGTGTTGVAFGTAGQALSLGWTDRFRELNFTVQTAAAGWAGRIEYVSEVNADGSPKAWKTLQLLSNGTNGFTTTGQILFDPPADWKAAKLRGTTQLLYYVRVVTTQGTGPTARSLFGRDYVGAGSGSSGTIPAFDNLADTNGDRYLSDAEYANRRAGMNARFEHESRLFYPYYGQMRFVTNPNGLAVQRWAADYHKRLVDANPHADGVFLDNSNGKLPFTGTPVKESVATFTEDLAAAVGAVTRALPGKWVVANTVGSIAEGDPIARESTAAFEEFLLRPNDHNWSNLIDIQDRVNRRLAADSPSPYVIIDTHPGYGSIATERTRMGSLAYYYLLADPDKTFLMFFGGYKPSAKWSDVFVPAATTDVGRPKGAMTTFATGADPQNANLTYKVYGREYDNALVLFKPKSYTLGKGTGTTDDATGTVHQLTGSYRQLYSDGSLGQVVTSVRLRNGEGMVLVKA